MNTPITKRMQINRHLSQKKSAAKLTEDEKKKKEDKKPAITADTKDDKGNLTRSTGTGNDGERKDFKRPASTDKCGTKAQVAAGTHRITCEESGYTALQNERKTSKDPCLNFKCKEGTPTKVSDTECKCSETTDPSSKAEHKPVVTEATDRTSGSIVDAFTSSEMRNTIKKIRRQINMLKKRLALLIDQSGLTSTFLFLALTKKLKVNKQNLSLLKI